MESSSDCKSVWIWSLNLKFSTIQNYYQTMSSRKNLVSHSWISSSNKYFNKQIIHNKTKFSQQYQFELIQHKPCWTTLYTSFIIHLTFYTIIFYIQPYITLWSCNTISAYSINLDQGFLLGFALFWFFISCYLILGNKIQTEKAKTHKLLLRNEENNHCKQ